MNIMNLAVVWGRISDCNHLHHSIHPSLLLITAPDSGTTMILIDSIAAKSHTPLYVP